MSAVVLAASADVVQTGYNTEETAPPEEFTEPYVAPPTLRFRELADGTMEAYMYDDEMWAYYYSLTAYYVGNLIIPSTYNGKPVTRISKLGGHGISIVDSITIPESITYIEEDAFSDFYGVKTIYYNAVNCKHMGNVSSDGNIRSIFNEDTSSIENIVIGEKVEVIPDYAFYGLTNLKEIAIPDTVTSIGQYSFKGNSQLESIHIPDNVRRIGDYAFADCSKLKTIIFDAVNCEIGTFTTDFNNVKVNPAFDGCTSLESIVFGENVEVIPNFAFYGAKNLKEITIPENIKSIGGQIFGTATIETLNYNSVDCTKAGISWNEYIDGGEGGWWESFTRTPFYGTKVQQLNINSTVNNLPNGLIGNMDIVSVNISAQLSSVGGFSNMQSLVEVSLPQSITEIKENAFANCPNLSIINIPYAVNKVGTRAFENTAWLNNQPKGCVYINNVLYKYKSTGQQDNVTIREGTTDILENAFSGADNVQSIILPNSLTSIGNNAFSDCSALKEISIPDSVISLGTSAFYNCSSLSSVILGNGINNIESNENNNIICKYNNKNEIVLVAYNEGISIVSIIKRCLIKKIVLKEIISGLCPIMMDSDVGGSKTEKIFGILCGAKRKIYGENVNYAYSLLQIGFNLNDKDKGEIDINKSIEYKEISRKDRVHFYDVNNLKNSMFLKNNDTLTIKDDKNEQFINMQLISFTLVVSQFEMSGIEYNDEQFINKELILITLLTLFGKPAIDNNEVQ